MPYPTAQRLQEMYELLMRHFGPQNWWPADSALEMMVGAILTQNTNWKNVERVIEELKRQDLLSLERLHSLSLPELAERIRPVGYFNIKAKRLKSLVSFIMGRYEGDLEGLLKNDPTRLREGLLSVKGVGQETADSMLLYGAKVPIFVVDAYTHRILVRHGMMGEEATYEEIQALFMDHLPEDARIYNEFHALIVRIGKEYCRKRPLCDRCPLVTWGPVRPE